MLLKEAADSFKEKEKTVLESLIAYFFIFYIV
jgi:hypothetical protein